MGGAQILKNSAVFTEIESDFSAEIGNSNDFSAQNQVISKKKKRSSPKIESDFSAEIGNSDNFSAQNQVISKKKQKKKKKKKVFTGIGRGFSAETVSFTVTLLFNYCYVRNHWKKTATKHRQAMLS